MISRKLIAALVGLTLVGGTVASASAATGPVGAQTVVTKSVSAKETAPHVRKVVLKHHRTHLTHRVIKRARVVKLTGGKRLALSHAAKRIVHKHA